VENFSGEVGLASHRYLKERWRAPGRHPAVGQGMRLVMVTLPIAAGSVGLSRVIDMVRQRGGCRRPRFGGVVTRSTIGHDGRSPCAKQEQGQHQQRDESGTKPHGYNLGFPTMNKVKNS